MVGMFMGLYIASFTWQYESARPPSDPELVAPPTVTPLTMGFNSLSFFLRLPYNGDCVRQGVYQLRFDQPGQRPRFYPLGTFINGAHFSTAPRGYSVDFLLPPNVHGRWSGMLRLHYSCPPLMLRHFDAEVPLGNLDIP